MTRFLKLTMALAFLPLLYSIYGFSPAVYTPRIATAVYECNDVPEINQQIIKYVAAHLNKKVDRGECWDLAAGALNSVNATWDEQYEFGRALDPKNECIYPGDIIQFQNVKLKYLKDNRLYEEMMSHHTAIIYKTNSQNEFVLAHQNIASTGKKVGLTEFCLADITRGKIWIYRPVPGS